MNDLLIVSNRGPFSFTSDFLSQAEGCLQRGERPEAPPFGEGGLVQAMSGLLKPGKWKTTWLGASMGNRDIDVARGHYKGLFNEMVRRGFAPGHFPSIEIEPVARMHFKYRDYDFYMRFVFFDTRHMHSYYSKFANGFLWPLMHLTRSPLFYKKARAYPRPEFSKNDFIQYMSSGVTFANTIFDEVQKGRKEKGPREELVIWNQDYHLMQIAETYNAILREQGKGEEERIHVGQFMHTPIFDIHEIQGLIREDKRYRVKSRVIDPFGETIESVLQKLIWGLLSNDFIGFHTKEYCDSYLEALEEWFPVDIRVSDRFYEVIHQDGVTTIGAFPIGLGVDRILREVTPDRVLEQDIGGSDLRDLLHHDRAAGKVIFGGLERCDYTKGLIERMAVFRNALGRLQAEGGDARFYQVTAPSRSQNPDYQQLNRLLEQEISSSNRKLGGGYIVHIPEGIPPPQNYRFMREVDVMLVTPLEDGMNLVAFEYILSQKFRKEDERGLLALSASGASRVLKERGFGEEDGIVFVNPQNPRSAGEKITAALKTSRCLSERVIRYVEEERRLDDWAEKNIQAIMNCRKKPQTAGRVFPDGGRPPVSRTRPSRERGKGTGQ